MIRTQTLGAVFHIHRLVDVSERFWALGKAFHAHRLVDA